MAEKEIKITFPEEKMEALVFFLGEQNEKLESVLTSHLDKTYEKYVPQQVRKFVDSRISLTEEGNVPQTGAQRQGRRGGRQNAEQNTRQSDAASVNNRTAGNSKGQELTVESEALEQEEAQSMSMRM